MKKYTLFKPRIRSRHPSHNIFRPIFNNLPLFKNKSVIRFGSTTDLKDTISNGGNRIEINTIQAVKNSASKLLMKQKFEEAGVKTAAWFQGLEDNGVTLEYPIVAKAHYGSKGKGNTLLKTHEEYLEWTSGKNLSNYIFEKFVNYGYEFRLHVTKDGCFYACRKALKSDCPEDQKWRRHDDTCVWLLEENETFNKPNSWEDIEKDCVKALESIGADILSFDVKVQTPYNKKGELREYQDYILLECNSASSMGDNSEELTICSKKYIETLTNLITNKIKLYHG